MAWDSMMTAQMIGSYQGMYAQQMGFAQQLSGFGQAPYSPYAGNSGMMANNMALGGMRAAGSMGNAAMTVAGIGAGMGVMAAGGGMLASTGVGIPIAMAGMAATYAGGQMMHGAEQQAALNQSLRGSFAFRNQYGGHGFSQGQMGQIGGALREMSHQFGPGGEITSFGELSALASKMGQMNMSQGVRDVQTFTKKFKEMTDALKSMAKDLGTSLEGALEFANSAKQSGVFGFNRMAGFTSAARGAAVSGGLAMSEVTSAAAIGSQISRSIGGLGRQGAMAGVKTIGQIGTATQMGILSEEDIYNVTGLTGAEGRQAFAASQMQQSASFLRSGRGRRMLASMAGKDGSLDMQSVEQIMSGSMGVPETMSESQKHLGAVGRANFIRNEGRLRGEAMEKLGGFLPAIQMRQWAQSKGIDINEMDDRSMLFAQRQLGMGRDEADAAIRMAQNMPQIMAQMGTEASSDRYFQKMAQQRKTRGLEGMKNRFDQAKETINGHLEKMGQDIFNEASSQIETFLNKLAGVYVDAHTADLNKLERDIRSGGSVGAQAKRRALNMGPGAVDFSRAQQFGAGTTFQGTEGTAAFFRGSEGNFGASVAADFKSGRAFIGASAMTETSRFLFQGQSDASKMKAAGYDLSALKGGKDTDLQRELDKIAGIAAGGKNIKGEYMQMAAGANWIDEAYAMDKVKGRGRDRLASFEAEAKRHGGPIADALARAKTDEEKASIMASVERARGIQGENAASSTLAAPDTGFRALMGQKFASEDERLKAIGSNLGTVAGPTTGQKALGGALAGLIPFGGMFLSEKATNLVSGDAIAKQKRQAGIIASENYQNLVADVFSGDATTRKAGMQSILAQSKGMKEGDDKAVYQDLYKLAQYNEWLSGNTGADQAARDAKAKELGLGSGKDAETKIGKHIALHESVTKQNNVDFINRMKEVHGDIAKKMKSHGLMTEDGKLRKLSSQESSTLGAGAGYLKTLVESEAAMAGGTFVDTSEARMAAFSKMSIAEKRKFAQMAAGTHEGAMAAEAANIEGRIQKGAARGRGGVGTAADILGVKLGKGEQVDAAGLAGMLGIADNADAKKNLEQAVALMSKKGATVEDQRKAAALMQDVKGVSDAHKAEEEKKKKEEQEKDSPMFRTMEKVEKHLEKIEGHSKNSTQFLSTISTNTGKDDGASK